MRILQVIKYISHLLIYQLTTYCWFDFFSNYERTP